MASPPSHTSAELVEPFLDQHRERWAANTVRAYRADILRFLDFMTAGNQPLTLATYLAAHPQWTRATARCAHSRISTFLRYAEHHSAAAIQIPPTPSLARSGRSRQVFQPEEISRILAQIPGGRVRDALLFRLIYHGCLRVGEATRLRSEDVWYTTNDDLILKVYPVRPGREIKSVLLTDRDVTDRLRSYLQGRPGDALLFQASKVPGKEPLRQQNVYKRWKLYCALAGLECSLEDLRISGAALLMQQRMWAEVARRRRSELKRCKG